MPKFRLAFKLLPYLEIIKPLEHLEASKFLRVAGHAPAGTSLTDNPNGSKLHHQVQAAKDEGKFAMTFHDINDNPNFYFEGGTYETGEEVRLAAKTDFLDNRLPEYFV